MKVSDTALIALIVLGMVLGGSTALAQGMTPIELYGGISNSSPKDPGSFSDRFGSSWGVMIGAGTRSFQFMEIVGKYELHRFSSTVSGVDDGLISAQLFGVDGKFNLSIPGSPIEPFGLLGGGLSWLRQSGLSDADPGFVVGGQTDLYYNFGLGAQLQFSDRMGFFVAGRWTTVFASQNNQALMDNLQFFAITIGVKFLEQL